MRHLPTLLALLGLALGTVLIGWYGFDDIVASSLSAGWRGLALLTSWQMVLFAILGIAWNLLAQPARRARSAPVYIWGRMVRDSASNCLPLAQVGGFVFGARAVTLLGVPWPLATASTLVDVTAEVMAQAAFAAIGLCILVAREPQSALAIPVAIGIAVVLAGLAGFVVVQQGASPLFARLGRRIAGRGLGEAQERLDAVQAELNLIYGRPSRLAMAAFIHLFGWLGTGLGGYFAYRLLGAELEIEDAMAIEALLHVILAAAFLVPGNLGVQEAAYAGLGTIFGIPPELSLGVSLLRRARDLLVGMPILLIWQFAEARRLRTASQR